jgi:hypothetical protein
MDREVGGAKPLTDPEKIRGGGATEKKRSETGRYAVV